MIATLTPAQEAARMVDSLGPEALAKAQAYTTGNHWVLLGGVLVSVLVAVIMVRLRLLDRIAARFKAPQRFWPTLLVSAAFLVISTLIALPWTLYTDWHRERAYGLSSQPLSDFLGQLAISETIGMVIGGLFLTGVYALIGKTGKRWWLWSGGLAGVVTLLALLAGPPLIEPLFNDYQPVPPGEVRTALEEIAEDVDIPKDRIFMYDGSRQSDRFTANVSGVGPSARIAIADVALKEASLAEVRAVTGHEAGHYKLGHIWRYVLIFPLLAMAFFFLLDRLFVPTARMLGSDAQLDEARGLPVFAVVGAVLGLLVTPLTNTLTRVGEAEADIYSLETVNEPDALATALVKTAEYRYPRPSGLEEALFYTHPSVEKRALRAMEWKAAHPKPETPPTKAP
ncbi:MAG: M48 family metallopeptidase [Erythrobacter sp.]|uniref:M48 family metallopeptidase n=1 Tax=Erythrobacter sp. TaxID=1042 RepID=UPI0025D4DF5D|nr:M48 family metallopeptidase [Erythrobacter sp.]MCL9999056.1 M48 family metallopeptidase [Erythrobacter sp.]